MLSRPKAPSPSHPVAVSSQQTTSEGLETVQITRPAGPAAGMSAASDCGPAMRTRWLRRDGHLAGSRRGFTVLPRARGQVGARSEVRLHRPCSGCARVRLEGWAAIPLRDLGIPLLTGQGVTTIMPGGLTGNMLPVVDHQ